MSTRNWICRNKAVQHICILLILNPLMSVVFSSACALMQASLTLLLIWITCTSWRCANDTEFTRLSAGYLCSNWDLVWLCCWQGLTTYICCASSLLGTATHTLAHTSWGLMCDSLNFVFACFRPGLLFLELNIQTHWSMQQGRDFKGNPTDVSGRFELCFSVFWRLSSITALTAAQTAHRKTRVRMIPKQTFGLFLCKSLFQAELKSASKTWCKVSEMNLTVCFKHTCASF